MEKAEQLLRLNKIFKKAITNKDTYGIIKSLSNGLSNSINTYKLTIPDLQTEDIALFYVALGYIAVEKDIDILDVTQINKSLAFHDLSEVVATIYTQGFKSGVIEQKTADASATFSAIYSSTSLSEFSNEAWSNHVNADINEIAKKVDKETNAATQDQWLKNVNKYFEDDGADALFQYDEYIRFVKPVLEKVYSSSYQLIKPYIVVKPTEQAIDAHAAIQIIKNKSSNQGQYSYTKSRASITRGMANAVSKHILKQGTINIDEDTETFKPSVVFSQPDGVITYFIKPHAKLLFGYNLVSNNADNLGQKKYATWAQVDKDLDKALQYWFKTVIKYIFETDADASNMYDINGTDSLSEAVENNLEIAMQIEDALKGYYKRFAQSIITTAVISEYSGSKDSPAKFVLRVVAPTEDYDSKVVIKEITNAAGTVLNQEGGETVFSPTERITKSSTYGLDAYQIEHTYNQKVANATPIFAAKALNYLRKLPQKPNTPVVSWQNMLVGMRTDGQIEVGQNNAKYMNNILHWLQAGSRSGKGVMSYNIILSALSDDKLFFYNDRKPDTSKVLITQAGGKDEKGRPQLAVVNGGQRNALAQNGSENWIVNWQDKAANKHKPNWLKFSSEDQLADYIYLRQYLIVMSLTSAIANRGMTTINEALGFDSNYVTGLFSVLDEYTNFTNGLGIKLHPHAAASFVPGIPNDKAIKALKNTDGDAFAKFNNFKPNKKDENPDPTAKRSGYYAEMHMNEVFKHDIMNALINARSAIIEANNAGLANNNSLIDILVIGQGIDSYYAKDPIGFDVEKEGAKYNKDKAAGLASHATRDIVTDTLESITLQDFVLGWPNGKASSDFLGVETGKNPKAAKYINGEYRGFAYISRADLLQPENAFIFKPFLLLNEGTELDGVKSKTADASSLAALSEKYNNAPGGYLAFLAKNLETTPGISWQTVREEVKEDLKLDDPDYKESLAGVIPYANEIGFEPTKYQKTLNFMNAILAKIGYDGDYLDFVTDTRPEWFIGVGDIEIAIFDDVQAFRNRPAIEGVRTYANSPLYDNETIDKELLGFDSDIEDTEQDSNVSEYDDDVEDIIPGMSMVDIEQPDINKPEEDFEEDEDFDGVDDNADDIDTDIFDNPISQSQEESETADEQFDNLSTQPVIPNEIPNETKQEMSPIKDEVIKDFSSMQLPELAAALAAGEITPTQFNQFYQALDENKVKTVDSNMANTNLDTADEDKDKEVRNVLDTAYNAGKHDAENSRLIYLSEDSKTVLKDAECLGIDIYTQYQEGFKTGFSLLDLNKRNIFLEKINSHLPGASETRQLLGLQEQKQEPFIQRMLNSDRPVKYGIDTMKNSIMSLHSNLESIYGAKAISDANATTGNMYTSKALSGYGEPSKFISGGIVGELDNVKEGLNEQYQDTGSVDTDLMRYMQSVTVKIINKLGGFKQIKRINVLSNGRLIINNSIGINFAIPVDEYNKLPIMIQRSLDNKAWGQLVVWSVIQQLPNLNSLVFDSYDFVVDYVRPAIKPSESRFDQQDIFEYAPQLITVTIGTDTVNIDETDVDETRKALVARRDMHNKYNEFLNNFKKVRPDEQEFTSRLNRDKAIKTAKQETRRKRAQAISSAANDTTNKGVQVSRAGMRNTLKQPGFKKLLFVAPATLFLASGTGLLAAKAVSHYTK